MSLLNIFSQRVELVVIRDALNPADCTHYNGYDLEQLIKQAFDGKPPSDNVRFYHGDLLLETFLPTERKDRRAIKRFCELKGRVYAVVKPQGLATIITVGLSILASVAVAFLMPIPEIPTNSGSTPPSPNNSLAQRTNRQRLGGRIPDIFGQVWSVPDLIAPTYSVYIDHKEVEYSYMCVGRGKYEITEALDDTTPINQIRGATVLTYNPDSTLNDEPAKQFGNAFTPDEAEWSRLATKRYTAVNGQKLNAPDDYLKTKVVFKNPNIIETSDNINFADTYKAGDALLIEGADNLASANNVTDADGNAVTYTLNGQYEIASIADKQITLVDPAAINTDWQKLADNTDLTVEGNDIALSTKGEVLWQGWFYTDLKEHDGAYINITAPALYRTGKNGDWVGLRIYGEIESEIVDSNNNPIAGTSHMQTFTISSPNGDKYGWSNKRWHHMTMVIADFDETAKFTKDEDLRASAAATVKIQNPNFVKGKRIRWRAARTSSTANGSVGTAVDEIKLTDFYGYRLMQGTDYPKGFTTVLSKTLATEGATSIKERKLKLLAQRWLNTPSGTMTLSKRIDDIIYHIATDPKIGNLTNAQIDYEQHETEVDLAVNYFGTDKCLEFCHTFDNRDISAEETIQTVASAGFCQAKRYGNKIYLDFERKTPASVAIFNSHNILPNTYAAPQKFGIANDWDGVEIKWTDPFDDAQVTMSYPSDNLANPHKETLTGVRNKVQAHMHMMRMYNRDRHAYKSCEFVAGDESNTVVTRQRITVADQLRADVQQGSVESIKKVGSNIIMQTSDPVLIDERPHTLYIQTINNGVESIPVYANDSYSVKLGRLPSGEISTDYTSVVQATYQIVAEQDSERDSYIVTTKDPSEGFTNKLTAINYTDKYYQNDDDFKEGLIT